MSHHYSGPDFSFPAGDARVDICDLFAFARPDDRGRSILIMTVHPTVGVNPPGPTGGEPFAPEASYEFLVDANGDAAEDVVFAVSFGGVTDGAQTATVRRIAGGPGGRIEEGDVVVAEAPVSDGGEARVTEAGRYRFFAGIRSDPFFADVRGALNRFQFTGSDYFADRDVHAIVLEVPNDTLGSGPRVGLWCRTLLRAPDGTAAETGVRDGWRQVDRAALPEQANFLVPGEIRGAYLAGQPAQDSERYLDVLAHALGHAGQRTPEQAREVARTLLPEILPYDYTRPAAFPRNGRSLTDDVIDHFLGVLTDGRVTSDLVGPHQDLLSEFPYLGVPHGLEAGLRRKAA